VSEILNGTSAQLGYIQCCAIHVSAHWKIQDGRQIKNGHTTKTKHNPVKANNANTAEQKFK